MDMQAEMIFASFIIGHNIFTASAEHVRPLFNATIAKIQASARAIITLVLKLMAHFTQNRIIDILKNNS